MTTSSALYMEAPPLPYYLESGFTVYQPGQQHPNRNSIGVFDLIFVTEGVLHIGEEDSEWALGAGESLLLMPDRYHYAVKACETETHFYWMHLKVPGRWQLQSEPDSEELGEYAEGSLPPKAAIAFGSYSIWLSQWTKPADPERLTRDFQRLMELAVERRSLAFWEEQKLFLEILQTLDEGHQTKASTQAVRIAEQTEAYLKRHYAEDIGNETLAEELHFHTNYIIRCMKQVHHCTPLEYLQHLRIEQAKLLLVKTEWTIAHIAERIGFHSAPYFSNCFKVSVGLPPLRYRKQFAKA